MRSVVSSEPGVVELVVTGLFQASAARSFQRTVLQYMSASGDVRGLMVDLRRATILIDAEAGPLPHPEEFDAPRHLKPIALVVPAVSESPFRQWAWEGVTAGLVRGAFVDAEEALAWIRSRSAARPGSARDERGLALRIS